MKKQELIICKYLKDTTILVGIFNGKTFDAPVDKMRVAKMNDVTANRIINELNISDSAKRYDYQIVDITNAVTNFVN